MLVIGFLYGNMWIENRKLRAELGEEEYTPTRQVFICQNANDHIVELWNMCIAAHEQANIKYTKHVAQNGRYKEIEFENGDVIILIHYGATVSALKNINRYTTRVFFNYALPDGAIRASIDALGLRNYLISFGICDETQGGK
jgi:hypothetical protein